MKIALFAVNGGYTHTNLAIRCLRQTLASEGFSVSLIEHNLRDRTDSMLDALIAAQADVYGFSCYIWNLPVMLTLAADLRALRPDAIIWLGGPEVSYSTERFDEILGGDVDYIISGEGEAAVSALIRALRDGVPPTERILFGAPQQLADGIVYTDNEDLRGKLVYYESARGCPFACSYCLSSRTDGIRAKSAETVIADLRRFEGRGVRTVKLVDRTFNFSPSRANAIWRALLEEGWQGEYHFEICASLLNEESMAILSRMPRGRVRLEVGLQSTNPPTLAAVNRRIDPRKVVECLTLLRRAQTVHIHLDLIAGLPFECYSRFAQSFDEAYFCCDVLQLGHLKLLHGTQLRSQAEEYGYTCTKRPPYAVLSNNWISYDELRRLDGIADLLERYRDSGRFSRALDVLISPDCSPFSRWEGLLDHIEHEDGRPISRISQPDAYRLLFGYAGTVLNSEMLAEFNAALRADYAAAEVRGSRIPW
ncbi:MAG: DUF4080 domain-containing protein [Clostridia bacterium]|nr:DUF4080 domain-containing protein [Clostridia bacterium]